MRRILILAALAAPALFGGSTANAALVFEFGQSTYVVPEGSGPLSVEVYLVETGSTFLSQDGLIGTGVKVSFTTAGTAAQLSQVISTTDIVPNPAFDGETDVPPTPVHYELDPGISAGFAASVALFSPPVFASQASPPYRILLGTFVFTLGQAGTTTITAGDLRLEDDNVTGGFNSMALDSLIVGGSAIIEVSAVPEPSTWVAAGVGLGTTVLWSLRRRREALLGRAETV